MKLQHHKVLFYDFSGRQGRTLVVASSEKFEVKNCSLVQASINLDDRDTKDRTRGGHSKKTTVDTAADERYFWVFGKDSVSSKAFTTFGFHLEKGGPFLKNNPTCSRTHVKSMLHRNAA